jgi:hypothetical protein
MWFRTLFDTLLARPSRTSRKRRPAPSFRRRSRYFRPLLGILEERTLLSTYVVDSLTDTGAGSGLAGDLRYCVTNATSGNDTITFAPGLTGTINVAFANALTLNASVAIQGPGYDPGGLGFRVNVDYAQFFVGSTATVAISGLGMYYGVTNNVGGGTLTVSGCNMGENIVNSGTATVSHCYFGGAGINNYGTMTIGNSIFAGSFGNPSSIANGGMLTLNYSTVGGLIGAEVISNWGEFTINNSTLSNNASGIGAIYMSAGTLSINSSTLAGNQAFPAAIGGLYIAGGTVSINNSTIADNQGGIYNAADPSALRMFNTILADNGPDLDGGVTSLGHNLIGNTYGGSGFDPTDLLNVDPLLGPLQDNGGASAGVPMAQHVVQTMALLAGSPALNAGDLSQLGVPDQRGVIRAGGVNIGAYQASASALVFTAPVAVTAGTPFDITVKAVDPFGQTAVGYGGAVHFVASNGAMDDYTFTGADGGQHTFSGLVLRRAQALTVTGTDTGNDSITGSTSFTITPAAADHLLFLQQPTDAAAGQTISPVSVALVDAFGNVVTDDNSDTITLSIGVDPSGGTATLSGTLSGTLTVAVVNGVATFGDLSVDLAGVGYTLHAATGGGLPDLDSNPFTITM